ncbi:MAG: GFA family protein [Candidatus Lambdaproteobacteria bacterium]|nr:GFA family protein [Candidatus Lambdaproteobacteria bacterium]
MRTYHGSCHCGRVKFEIETDLTAVVECNCSICSKKGALHHRVPPERFRLLAGEDALAVYRFNTATAQHLFCRHCGIHSFSRPRLAPDQYTVNVRCLDDFDLAVERPEVRHFDGRNFEQAASTFRPPGASGPAAGKS